MNEEDRKLMAESIKKNVNRLKAAYRTTHDESKKERLEIKIQRLQDLSYRIRHGYE